MASIAPCRCITLSEAPRSGTTRTTTRSITSLVNRRLYTARQRPAMCRTAENGCCRHWSSLSVEDNSWTNISKIKKQLSSQWTRLCCSKKNSSFSGVFFYNSSSSVIISTAPTTRKTHTYYKCPQLQQKLNSKMEKIHKWNQNDG